MIRQPDDPGLDDEIIAPYPQLALQPEMRAMNNHRPPATHGCICPPTSEQTCQSQLCPRKGLRVLSV